MKSWEDHGCRQGIQKESLQLHCWSGNELLKSLEGQCPYQSRLHDTATSPLQTDLVEIRASVCKEKKNRKKN